MACHVIKIKNLYRVPLSACNEGLLVSVKSVFDPKIPSLIYGCFIAFSAFLQALTVRSAGYRVLSFTMQELSLSSQRFPVRIGFFAFPKLQRFLWIRVRLGRIGIISELLICLLNMPTRVRYESVPELWSPIFNWFLNLKSGLILLKCRR